MAFDSPIKSHLPTPTKILLLQGVYTHKELDYGVFFAK